MRLEKRQQNDSSDKQVNAQNVCGELEMYTSLYSKAWQGQLSELQQQLKGQITHS